MSEFTFPIGIHTPPQHAQALPDKVDVVIIGGGVIGICAALFLRRQGQSVFVCEKGRVAGEQSSRNWGWIRQQGRDPDELPIMMEANRLWQDLNAQLDCAIGLQQGGIVYFSDSDSELEQYETFTSLAADHGLESNLMSRSQVQAMIPDLDRSYRGALHTPSDMRAEPWVAVPALARLAAAEGVLIRENCAVRRLDTQNGQISGVITEHGHIACEQALLCGGAWSSLFLQGHGVRIPQLSVRATVVKTSELPEVFAGGAVDSKLAFRHRADGGYSLATSSTHDLFLGWDGMRHAKAFWPAVKNDPFNNRINPFGPPNYPDSWTVKRTWSANDETPFERTRVINPAPSQKAMRIIKKSFDRAFPQFKGWSVSSAWAGLIDTMPDVVPIIDQCSDIPGLTIATGMSGHGFGIGPGVGRVVADMMSGKHSNHILYRFRYDRFKNGDPIILGPAL